jgi:hypothetical protein
MVMLLALAAAMFGASETPSQADWPGYAKCVEGVSKGLAERDAKRPAREIADLTIDFCEDAANSIEGKGGLYTAAERVSHENPSMGVIDAFDILRSVAAKVRAEKASELTETIDRSWPRTPAGGR